jgi:hypothetical protein
MRINVKQRILDYEGNPILVNKTNPDGTPVLGEDHRPIQEPEMLRNYLALALNNTAQGENEVFTPEQKAKIYALTTKLYSKKEVDLTLDDRAFIKDRVGKLYGPLIYGRICDVLEGESSEPAPPSVEGSEEAAAAESSNAA